MYDTHEFAIDCDLLGRPQLPRHVMIRVPALEFPGTIPVLASSSSSCGGSCCCCRIAQQ